MEIWKDIKGYEGLYQASNLGNIKSLDHIRKKGKKENQICISKGKILKQAKQKESGYMFVVLSKNGKTKGFRVHRLIAETFLDNFNNYKCVNHKDENKENNNANNLEWCSYLYNNNYGTKKDRLKISQQKRAGRKVNQYDLNNNFIKEWNCFMDIERYLKKKGANAVINACCRGKLKTAYGFRWEYAD